MLLVTGSHSPLAFLLLRLSLVDAAVAVIIGKPVLDV